MWFSAPFIMWVLGATNLQLSPGELGQLDAIAYFTGPGLFMLGAMAGSRLVALPKGSS